LEFSLNHPDLDPAALSGSRLQKLKSALEDNNLCVSAMSYRCADEQNLSQSLDSLKKGMEVALSLGTNLLLICTAPQSSDPDGRQTTTLLSDLLHHAQEIGLIIAVDPEPDTVIHGLYEFSQMANRMTGLPLGLDLNVSHCACTEGNVDEVIAEWASFIVSAHISDAERNQHNHLIPGQGHLDINRAVQALRRYRYHGDLTLDLEPNGTAFEEMAVRAMENCKQLFC
ncbi:sugar phosphate isomerase/epimerase, partial [bacterium]|nr:sugar phosphate isomerase/epimerase [bacterium]